MPSFWAVPPEIRSKILKLLNIRDQMSAAEASPLFEEVCNGQIESNTDFKLKEGKETLVLVVDEVRCAEATKMALVHYPTCHLIIARSIVMSTDSNEMTRLLRWLWEVTVDGENKFATIEMVGKITTCACKFADLLR